MEINVINYFAFVAFHLYAILRYFQMRCKFNIIFLIPQILLKKFDWVKQMQAL